MQIGNGLGGLGICQAFPAERWLGMKVVPPEQEVSVIQVIASLWRILTFGPHMVGTLFKQSFRM